MSSILQGVSEIIDSFFDVGEIGKSSPHYRHKKSCLKLSETPPVNSSGLALISDIYTKIESNWRHSQTVYEKPPSKENWRFEPRVDLDDNNLSPEVTLERNIVRASVDEWANQIPTSSGLCHHHYDKVRNIDLVHKVKNGSYQFIELKVDSDTPLYAVMEILIYGILHLFSRRHLQELEYDGSRELLKASDIQLRVLAPHPYYAPNSLYPDQLYDLKWLETLINDGLREFLDIHSDQELTMSFRFDAFPPDFSWSPQTLAGEDGTLQEALTGVKPVYSSTRKP